MTPHTATRERRGAAEAIRSLATFTRVTEPARGDVIGRLRPPVQLLPHTAVDLAIANADTMLRTVGLQVMDDEPTLELVRAAGATVAYEADEAGSGRVRWSLGALLEIAASAPERFVQHGRTAEDSVAIGRDEPTVFTPVYGPPNVIDDAGVRRTATIADYRSLVEIADAAPAIRNTGHMLCVPSDVPEPERYPVMAEIHLDCSGKPFMGSTASEASAAEVISLVTRTWGPAPVAVGESGCRLLHLCNSIPPLTWRGRMLGVLRAAARAGEGCIVASFQMLGATGPAAVLGALSQGISEAMFGVAVSQLHVAGAPVVFGIYAMPFDMRAMVPRFGDPISQLVQSGSVQLARRFNLPALAYGGLTSSKVDDAQAGAEAGIGLQTAVAVGADFVLHATGWLENGRTTGFAKFRREAAALELLAAH